MVCSSSSDVHLMLYMLTSMLARGVARNLLRGGGQGSPPAESRGRAPVGSGAKPPEAGDIYWMHNKENKQKIYNIMFSIMHSV